MINSRKDPYLEEYLAERKNISIGEIINLSFQNLGRFFLGYYFFLPILFISIIVTSLILGGLTNLTALAGSGVVSMIISFLVNLIAGPVATCFIGGYFKQANTIRKTGFPDFGQFFQGFENFKQVFLQTLLFYGIGFMIFGGIGLAFYLLGSNLDSLDFSQLEGFAEWLVSFVIERQGSIPMVYTIVMIASLLIGTFIFALFAFMYPFLFVNNASAIDSIVLSFKYGVKYYWQLLALGFVLLAIFLLFGIVFFLLAFLTPFLVFLGFLLMPILYAIAPILIYEIFNQVTAHDNHDEGFDFEKHLVQ